jgi:cation diffusion facilitator CzcD-associated flavoprotein CzcO
MVAYFDDYVRRQHITLKLGVAVSRIDHATGGWQLDTDSGPIQARSVVLCTGNYCTPMIPAWPGLKDFAGELVHSDEFTDALPYRDRDVLVVGAGNSGADIAVQLADIGAHRVWLAVRTPPHLVRRAVGPIPSDIFLEIFARVPSGVADPVIDRLQRLTVGDPSGYGFRRPPQGLKATVEARGRIPTLADGLIDAVRAGRVEVVGAVEAIEPSRVILANAGAIAPEVIIAATGFSMDLGAWSATSAFSTSMGHRTFTLLMDLSSLTKPLPVMRQQMDTPSPCALRSAKSTGSSVVTSCGHARASP